MAFFFFSSKFFCLFVAILSLSFSFVLSFFFLSFFLSVVNFFSFSSFFFEEEMFFCRPHLGVVGGGGVGDDAFRGRGRGRRLHEYQQKTTLATIKKKEENDQRKRGCRRRHACVLAVVAAFATAANENDGGASRARAASRDAIRIGGGKKGGEKVVSDFSNLKILLSEIKRTDAELSQMIGLLKRASEVGTDVPFDSMSFVFENRDSAIYNFQNNALKLDAFVDAEELTPIEAAVWDSIPQKNGGGVHTPFIVTPNEFVCALYSCVNSPDAPPSTEAALTIDMLRKGVSMGKRKDKRITADGLLLTAEDARAKVQRYVEILESSSIFSKSSK
jgi:hypothetical protein|tara:strand:+ start:4677 stop:5672 length:996 start_codon:yes stop_codon:yes gene_type:complete